MPAQNTENGNNVELFNRELLEFIAKRDEYVEENKTRRENRNIFQRLFDQCFGDD
tara:strand:- start:30 stop:194 length:165 start_codon:yes stop_codon:yes gene_type:complete